ncbi:ATP-dependent Clp protease ATP-binding subunit [Sediminicola luteus]|uniref:ATP-dependent Clp protease ATP-binding subunit n=1 Tax=Sediminicola luteus TaxID=319238 RepID=A0ABV2TZJ6_9FLAO
MTDVDLMFSEDLKKGISIAQSIAKEYSNKNISPSHLLKALLHKDIGLRSYLENLDKDLYYLEEWADVRIESYPKNSRIEVNPQADDELFAVLNEADNLRLKTTSDHIDAICALASLCTPGVGFTYEQLKTFPLRGDEILNSMVEFSDLKEVMGIPNKEENTSVKSKTHNALLKYCIDKSSIARQGKLDPVVARDKEIRMITEILGRRSKPNVILIGDTGVGKTAVISGLIQKLADNKIGGSLAGTVVFELDFGSLIAGASYKGEVEDRLKHIIKEIKQFENAILFIDEIHTLLDKQGGASGAANLLKPELARGEITILGTTSVDNYTKFIESDEAFNRSFEIIKIDEPNEIVAYRMLSKIIPNYEIHHGLKVDAEVLKETIRLSKRYLKERALPDAAVDLLDRTMAVVKMVSVSSKDDLIVLKEQFAEISVNEIGLEEDELIGELQWFSTFIKNKISEVLFTAIEEDQDVAKMETSKEIAIYIEEVLGKLSESAGQTRESIEKSDVAAVVSHKTGIPMGKLQSQERERLLNTEEHLKKRVVGQDHAIKTITEAILESRSGLSKPGQPIGSFFFLGPTGTGKTELAKTLAEFLFQNESALIRFDMSEFKEEHSAALLYGAPPGYVGYEEGGLLVNKIRQQPYAVVLFDEIEKAHASVFDIFLQILDEGKLHDRLGKEGDFSNAVILFTSNIASQVIIDSFSKGEIPKSNDIMEIMSGHFRPEFLGRLTEIVPFAPISKEVVVMIFNIHLKNLYKMLEVQGISLHIDDKAKEKLAMSGFTPKYGARPLIGVIRKELRRPLSRKIITGEVKRGSVVNISLDKNDEIIWKIT